MITIGRIDTTSTPRACITTMTTSTTIRTKPNRHNEHKEQDTNSYPYDHIEQNNTTRTNRYILCSALSCWLSTYNQPSHLLPYVSHGPQPCTAVALLRTMAEMLEPTGRGDHIEPYVLPTLVGNAGRQWLRRWRRVSGIAYTNSVVKQKLFWERRTNAILTIISNVLRCWNYYHPCNDLRLLSMDQKPTRINHVGHKRTLATGGCTQVSVDDNLNPTRDRYTLITSIKSYDDDRFPKLAILFQGRLSCYKMGNTPAATTDMATLCTYGD